MKKNFIFILGFVVFIFGVVLYSNYDSLFKSRPASSPVSPSPVISSAKEIAATLFLKPEKLAVSNGEIFSVEVLLDVEGGHAVALSAYVLFDADKLEFVSVDSSGSVFSIKAEEEHDGAGMIKITRGEPAPGVKGSDIKVAKVNFKAKATGEANIGFSLVNAGEGPTRVILDDGKGTDILMSAENLKFNISE